MPANDQRLWALLLVFTGLITLSTGCDQLILRDAAAVASAWEDSNCNGIWEQETERPLADVCIWADGQPNPNPPACAQPATRSSSAGGWQDFSHSYPTCQDVFIHAQAPDGFAPTTDTITNDCVAQFGFAPAGQCPVIDITTPSELAADRQQADLLRWAGLLLLGAGLGALWLRWRHR